MPWTPSDPALGFGIPLGSARRSASARTGRRTDTHLSPNVLTIGFARRAALYKRADHLANAYPAAAPPHPGLGGDR